MPGLLPFLPALQLPPHVCRNCGFWQRHFSQPTTCPLCNDARHVIPVHGWSFYDANEAAEAFPMHWEMLLPGLWRFWNDPVDGIGSHSYLLQNAEGNIIFEGATIYSEQALAFMRSLGGVSYVSASHPHTYGALWQLQDTFDVKIALHIEDLAWSIAFCVTHPFDDVFEIFPNLRLLPAGVHFLGQAFLHDVERGVLFCGDALKFSIDEKYPRSATAVSSHKSFVRSVPLTRREASSYKTVFGTCSFDKVYTPFEQVHNVDSEIVDRFLQRVIQEYPQPEFIALDSLTITHHMV